MDYIRSLFAKKKKRKKKAKKEKSTELEPGPENHQSVCLPSSTPVPRISEELPSTKNNIRDKSNSSRAWVLSYLLSKSAKTADSPPSNEVPVKSGNNILGFWRAIFIGKKKKKKSKKKKNGLKTTEVQVSGREPAREEIIPATWTSFRIRSRERKSSTDKKDKLDLKLERALQENSKLKTELASAQLANKPLQDTIATIQQSQWQFENQIQALQTANATQAQQHLQNILQLQQSFDTTNITQQKQIEVLTMKLTQHQELETSLRSQIESLGAEKIGIELKLQKLVQDNLITLSHNDAVKSELANALSANKPLQETIAGLQQNQWMLENQVKTLQTQLSAQYQQYQHHTSQLQQSFNFTNAAQLGQIESLTNKIHMLQESENALKARVEQLQAEIGLEVNGLK